MSEAEGSVQDGGQPGGVSNDAAAGAMASQAAPGVNGLAGGADWSSGLQDADNLKTVEAKGWKGKGLDDVVRSYRELESRIGQSLTVPSDDASKEDWDKFYSRTGRPEKADGYKFSLPSDLPENLPYDAASATEFSNWAHEAGLNQKQAQAIHDNFVRMTARQIEAHQAKEAELSQAAHTEIVREWGLPDTDQYRRNQEMANRAIRQLGLSDELKGIGALTAEGDVKAPKLAMALSKVGHQLFSEDTLYGGPSYQKNPWSDGQDFSMAAQGQIIRSNPDQARALIRQAGKDPKTFGL